MKINIFKAKKSDLTEIAYLFDAYRVFYQQKSDYDAALEFITQRFENTESIIFFAKDEHDKYLGFTQLFPSFSSVSAQKTWILNDLFVSQNCRSSGIGTLLLNKAKDFAVQTQAKGLMLETAADNTQAQKLYESLGYVKNTEFSYFLKI